MATIEALRFGSTPRAPHWWEQQEAVSPLFRRAFSLLSAIAGDRAERHWHGVFSSVLPIYRSDAGAATSSKRSRRIRHDHLQNVVCVLGACLFTADWSSATKPGFVGRPVRKEAGRVSWVRPEWSQLSDIAFGGIETGRLSIRRIERAVRELVAAGWLRTSAIKDLVDDEWRSKASIKLVTHKVWAALGLSGAFRQHLRMREKQAGRARKAELEAMFGAAVAGYRDAGQVPRGNARSAAPGRRGATEKPPPTRPPATFEKLPPAKTCDEAKVGATIEQIRKMLGGR